MANKMDMEITFLKKKIIQLLFKLDFGIKEKESIGSITMIYKL